MTSDEVIKRLEAAGWSVARQKGSHVTLKKDGEPLVVTIPHPRRNLGKSLLKATERISKVGLL